MKKHLIIILFLMFLLGIEAQEKVVEISRTEILTKVAENNNKIKISEQEYLKSKADFRTANSVFLPKISLSYTAIVITNPLMAFGSKLNQEILTQNDFDPNLLNNPNQIENFATIIEVQQPLINLDGIQKRKSAKSQMEAFSLQSKRTEDYMAFEVEKAFLQLQLAYKAVDVLEKALESATSNLELAKNKSKQGILLQADVMNVEIRQADIENQLENAKTNIQNISNYLSFLMNEQNDVVFIPKDELLLTQLSTEEKKTNLESRSDLKAIKLMSEAYEESYKAEKMAFLPRLNAFGSYQLYDDKIFSANADGYLIGAELRWNVLEGTTRFAAAQKSRAEYEKSTLEYNQMLAESKLELNKVNRQLANIKNKLDLTQLALQKSEESLRIRKNRFEEGLEKVSDLLMSEAQYAEKQMEHFQTIYEYNLTQSYLDFITKQ